MNLTPNILIIRINITNEDPMYEDKSDLYSGDFFISSNFVLLFGLNVNKKVKDVIKKPKIIPKKLIKEPSKFSIKFFIGLADISKIYKIEMNINEVNNSK